MRPLFVISFLIVTMIGCRESAEAPKPPSSQPQEAGNSAIGVLQKMVTDQNYRALGFDSVDQVKQAQLGSPFSVFEIGLNQLKEYKPGINPDTLLTPSSKTIYPVTVNSEVKSSVTISHKDNGYQASSFGSADIVKSLSRYRRAEAQGNDFVVRVPAFNMYYLGRHVNSRLLLVPIIDDTRLKLKTGEAVPAETVLEQLVPLANSYNGLPI